MVTNARRRLSAVSKSAADASPASRESAKAALLDRPSRILAAATRRFAEFGFEATTVRQLADDVDVMSGSLYHHFASKEEMLHEIVRDTVLQMRDNVIRISKAPLDAEHRLIALVLLDLGQLTENQQVHAILTNERKLFRRKEEFAYVVQAKKEAYLAWCAVLQDGIDTGLFRPDIDLYLTITTVIRMLNTAADWYKNEDAFISGRVGSYTLDQVIDFHIEFVLSAVRLPSREAEPIPRQACEDLARFCV
jgi:AcrR family transcriptional regulator